MIINKIVRQQTFMAIKTSINKNKRETDKNK